THIGGDAFADWTSCTSLTIPNSVTHIGGDAFADWTSCTSLTIPNSVTHIGWYAFQNWTSCTSITCLATTPPNVGVMIFYNTNNAPIYVPAESVDAYKTAPNWSTYASRIFAMPLNNMG
ncbi:leucine-rich repeat protein, partial [Acinetobacter haemolyticus]|uniref:leucine-rich repeat protein n=1 Tax=Acinetobacter haemolyticus TaxID=29430 RepID=UPI0013A5905D